MRRLLIALALVACAHVSENTADSDAQIAGEQPTSFSEGTIPPVRKKYRRDGPRLGERDRASGRLMLDYIVTEDEKMKDVSVSGDANAGAIKAIRAFLATCSYQPATQNGKAVAVKWKGELSFPKQ
jgi:hypothetical protein